MKSRMTRLGVVAATALVLGTVACAPQESAEVGGTLEVVSYHPEGTPLYDRLEELAEEFEARNDGLTVELTFGGGPGMPPIMTRYRAGDPPDVNPILAGQCPDGEILQAGLNYDLTDAMGTELADSDTTWNEAIYPAVRSQLTSWQDGSVCMAPESVTVIQFFYNKALFDENGVTPPTTMDELFEVTEELKAAGVTPFAVTGTFAYYMQLYFDYLLLRHVGAEPVIQAIGGNQVTQNPIEGERPLFADLPGVMDAAEDLQRLVSDGNLMEGFRSTDFTTAQMAFFQGDVGMILMGSWLVSEMADAIPEGFEIGTFAFPAVDGGSGDQASSIGGVQGLAVAAEAKNPEAAVEWLKFLGEKENQDAYARDFGVISAYEGVEAPAGFEAIVDMLADGNLQPLYFGLLGQSAETQAAIHEPLTQLFFGQIDAATMVTEISQRLDTVNQ